MSISYCFDCGPVLLFVISETFTLDLSVIGPLLVLFQKWDKCGYGGVVETASTNGLDQVKWSSLQSGHIVLEILCKALLMLLLEMLPLIAMVP